MNLRWHVKDEVYLLQVETGNKRPAGSALKTPAPEKKAKVISPAGNQKTGRICVCAVFGNE